MPPARNERSGHVACLVVVGRRQRSTTSSGHGRLLADGPEAAAARTLRHARGELRSGMIGRRLRARSCARARCPRRDGTGTPSSSAGAGGPIAGSPPLRARPSREWRHRGGLRQLYGADGERRDAGVAQMSSRTGRPPSAVSTQRSTWSGEVEGVDPVGSLHLRPHAARASCWAAASRSTASVRRCSMPTTQGACRARRDRCSREVHEQVPRESPAGYRPIRSTRSLVVRRCS